MLIIYLSKTRKSPMDCMTKSGTIGEAFGPEMSDSWVMPQKVQFALNTNLTGIRSRDTYQ